MGIEIKREYYPCGKLRSEVPLVNGIHHGAEKTYYENGKLKAYIPFINGKPFGIMKNFDKFGRLDYQLMFVEGNVYNEDGTRYMLVDYTKKRDGFAGVVVEFEYEKQD